MPRRGPFWTLAFVVPLILLCGDLGAPYPKDEVAFDAVRNQHFDAVAVDADKGAPSDAPLVVRVRLLGDAADADLTAPFAWLARHANVRVVPDERGAPLFLTRGDLAATSGRSTLGATVPTGMAVEMGNPAVGACVTAHEMLHFLGLRHVQDAGNVMYPHCSADMLGRVELDASQRGHLDAITAIRALTPRGMETWASR